MVNIKKDIAKFLQENMIPVNIEPKKDIMEQTKVKVSDILLGKSNDSKLDKMSDIFPQTNKNNNSNDFLS